MALDCTTCEKKHNAISDGHCSEFVLIPQLDQCEMHSDGVRAKAQAAKAQPTGSYIHLPDRPVIPILPTVTQ